MKQERHKAIYLNGYLMLTSMIQATAFAFYVASICQIGPQMALKLFPFILSELILIVAFTYGYMLGVRDVWWELDVVDVIIPFMIGLFEIMAINSIKPRIDNFTSWFVLLSLMFSVCILAVINGFIKTRRANEELDKTGFHVGREDHEKRGHWFRKVVLMLMIYTFLATISSIIFNSYYVDWFLSFVIFIMLIIILFALKNLESNKANSADAKSRAAD